MPENNGLEKLELGARVKVRTDCESLKHRGLSGTVVEGFGRAEYSAFDVRLEDGRSELFWRYELDELSSKHL